MSSSRTSSPPANSPSSSPRPVDTSVTRTVGAVLREQHDECAVAERRCLIQESMALIDRQEEANTINDNPELDAYAVTSLSATARISAALGNRPSSIATHACWWRRRRWFARVAGRTRRQRDESLSGGARIDVTSRYSSRPKMPHSRPLPDWRYPPNGVAMFGAAPLT